jgi:predicted RNase H-like HicB family nuclease
LVQDETDGPDDSYGVVFPDLPGCVSCGDTLRDAAEAAFEALALHVEGMAEAGQKLPSPSPPGQPLPDWLAGAGHVVATVLVPVEPPGKAVRTNITIDEGLLRRIDRAAAAEGNTRSGFLAQAAREWIGRNTPA